MASLDKVKKYERISLLDFPTSFPRESGAFFVCNIANLRGSRELHFHFRLIRVAWQYVASDIMRRLPQDGCRRIPALHSYRSTH